MNFPSILFVYTFCICSWWSSYQEGRVGIPLSGLTRHILCLSQAKFPMSYVVVCCFVCVQWIKVKGDCSFCWYWGNCWPSLYKVSFHIKNCNNYLFRLHANGTKYTLFWFVILFFMPNLHTWLIASGVNNWIKIHYNCNVLAHTKTYILVNWV